jgi:HK97 family phage major capsid protein
MPYNSQITRTDASALIPQQVSQEIIGTVEGTNPLMQLARRLPNMTAAQLRMPVLNALAHAYFVTGDTGLKQTTELDWTNKYIDAEELAVIVPIPEAVLDDSSYDIWAQVKPSLVAAFNRAITGAVLYGTNIPATWSTNLGGAGLCISTVAGGAAPAAHIISAAAYTDLYEAILGETAAGVDGAFMLVEADGFAVNGNVAHISMRGMLRNTRDTNGLPIFKTSMQDPTRFELDGTPIYFPTDGSIVSGSSLMISGDWNQLVYAMRQDITYKVLTEAVITDAAGNIIYNLAQQDMVALRAVMRLGFALPNPKTALNETDATRYPFAIVTA